MRPLEEFEAAGLYSPEADAETGRLDLLNWLDSAGVSVDDMVAAHAIGALGAIVGDKRLLPGDRLSRSEAHAVSSLPPAEFDTFARAFGFVAIDADPEGEVSFSKTEVESFELFHSISSMFSHEEALGFIRVVGSAIGRIADAAVSMFLGDVESPMVVEGGSELELALKVNDAIGLLDGFAAHLDPILRRHVFQAVDRSRRSMIAVDERFRYRYAVGFVDLVGFTEFSQTMNARELGEFIRDFEGRAHDVVTSVGARVVKLIGDEVMFVSPEPGAACVAASALMEGFGRDHKRVVPRGGLAYGDVLVRGGDYYGSVVNLASRLADAAVPQELLVTQELATASSSCQFEPAGRRMVKGFADPILVQSVLTSQSRTPGP